MIVGLQKSVPYVVKSSPEVKITWQWLWKEIDKCIETLAESGFNVRAVVVDDHSSNVAAYKKLHEEYFGDSETYIYHPSYGGVQKTYLLFDIIHLIKNVRNNLLNKKKFVFPKFSFNHFEDPIEVDDGYVDWRLFHQVYEKDQELQANLRKAHKMTYRTLHPGNNKQNVSLALNIFDETSSAAINSYFPARKSAASFLSLFHKLFVILNSKQKFNSNNRLGNAAVAGDNKPKFLREVADWVEKWSECEYFTLTPQTSKALTTTLRASASLIEDLLSEGYDYVLTARFQTDPLELRYSKYRQMSGGRFLVSLCEVTHSERILAIDSLLREDINFWEEDLRPAVNDKDVLLKIQGEVSEISSDLLQCHLSDDSKEVAVTIAGGVAKKLVKRSKCSNCKKQLIGSTVDVAHCDYLKLLSRGGLTCPSTGLAEFVCQVFSVLDSISHILQKHANDISIRKAAEILLAKLLDQVAFTCDLHAELGKKWTLRTVVNVFFNDHQKISNDSVRKDQVKDFKKRQRKLDQ